MNFIDLGEWEAYRVETEEGQAFAKYRNAAGHDWYSTVAHNPDRAKGIAALLSPEGDVVMAYEDVAHAEPRLGRPVVLPDYTGTIQDLAGSHLDLTTGELFKRTVPVAVSKAQAQMALYNIGLLDDLEAAIAAHPYRPVRIWYDSANYWERANPYVSMLAPELGLTDEQIDALFVEAAKL